MIVNIIGKKRRKPNRTISDIKHKDCVVINLEQRLKAECVKNGWMVMYEPENKKRYMAWARIKDHRRKLEGRELNDREVALTMALRNFERGLR